MSAVTLPRSDRFPLTSAGGRDYHILVAWPKEEAPPGGFPVIYQLDADASFATLVESLRLRSHRPDATGIRPAIVVGVGYPDAEVYDRAGRTYDYTPPRAAGDSATGGADAFLGFLRDELKPLIAARFAIDPAHDALIAHSLGGYFALRALLRAPETFRTTVAISPSIWWDAEGMTADLARFAPPPGRRVMIAVGEYEQGLAPWQSGPEHAETLRRRRERGMVDHARDVARALGARGAETRFELLPGEDHASAVPVALSHGLRFALAGAA